VRWIPRRCSSRTSAISPARARARHRDYVRLVEPLAIPDVCVIGNHDLDDPRAPTAWEAVHGPTNYDFSHGRTRFAFIDGAPGAVGELAVSSAGRTEGARAAALAYLDERLEAAREPHRVVFTHAPPHLDRHYEPHPEWGFTKREAEFLDIVRRHRVSLVCCAHGLAFDHHVHDDIHYVMSGGGGTGLCSY